MLQDIGDVSSTEVDHSCQVTTIDDIKQGKVSILFGSPEAFIEVQQYHDMVKELKCDDMIGTLAIDEAHCVLKYGYNRKTRSGKIVRAFRPAYSKLRELRAILGDTPVVAMTATLTTNGQKELKEKLNLGDCFTIVLPPKKDNITYYVHQLQKSFIK